MIVFLLSKPEYAFKILKGTKRYEFRKVRFRKDIDKVIVYATAPYSKIIGYFTAGRIYQESPKVLWNKFNEYSGIGKKAFFLYFKERTYGIAIKIKNPVSFRRHRKPQEILSNFTLPNSFRYLDEDQLTIIKKASA